jgi:ATP-dependent helicase/DNAse subunit B
MRLLLGEPGSGKTTRVLDEIRLRLREGRGDFRLVVPTATMAEHLRNLLARENLLVRPGAIGTLAGLLERVVPDLQLASRTALELLVGQALDRLRPRAFAPLSGSRGFTPSIASAIEDLSGAGCDSLQWAALRGLGVWSGPVPAALGEIYEAVEMALTQRGLSMRPAQLVRAARRVERDGLPGVADVYFDGFFSFAPAELRLLEALGRRVMLTVTLPEWPGAAAARETLVRSGAREERLRIVRAQAEETLVAAPSREREAAEIALRILDLRKAGLAWREMGVILRSAEPYAPLLEATFARLGIPARLYFSKPAAVHPVSGFLTAVLDAILSGFEWQATLRALRAAVSRPGSAPAADGLEAMVREALPGRGLEGFERVLGPAAVEPAIGGALQILRDAQGWELERLDPLAWARRLASLGGLVAPPSLDAAIRSEQLTAWSGRAAALQLLFDTATEVAALLGPEPGPLSFFKARFEDALASAALRPRDRRRDAVHVMDVYEARQWELPAVFVCGLLEGEFPRRAASDPVLGEELRLALRANGIPVATRALRDEEERFLFRFAVTRSTGSLVLSWPERDDAGEPTLPAFALSGHRGSRAPARDFFVLPSRPVQPALRPAISGDTLPAFRELHARLRATSVERYLACPFRFFASDTLRLEPLPPLPARRLDGRALGIVLHDVLAEWHSVPSPMPELFERHWQAMLRRLRIPAGHRPLLARLPVLRGLESYAAEPGLRAGWRTEMERKLTFRLGGTPISGRADRVDFGPAGEVFVYDFKFSGVSGRRNRLDKVEAGLAVQCGLYLAALRDEGFRPAGFAYAGLRNDSRVEPFEGEKASQLLELAVERTSDAVARLWSGEIPVRPARRDDCAYCDFLDACRISSEAGQAVSEAGE